MSAYRFPDGFIWGAAVSAYQTEGGSGSSDWCAWQRAGKVPPCGAGVGSWERWEEDVALASELGLGMLRISLEWSRLEPEPGRFDEAAFEHYAEILRAIRARGMQTMLVLWHFTHPLWFAEHGGWERPDALARFRILAERAAERYADLVDLWATLNEADTFVAQAFVRGVWPPGLKRSWRRGWRVYRRLAQAHNEAYRALKNVLGQKTRVGLTHAFTWARPVRKGGLITGIPVAAWNFLANDVFLGDVAGHLDWLGVQYYIATPLSLRGLAIGEGFGPKSDIGWRIEPRGLYEVVMRTWHRMHVPLIVTENGIADASDRQRARFIIDHLAWLWRAIERGADVRGYLHWSLIDNYEWALGFEPRFGLAAVDPVTHERALRPSARVFARIVADNALPEGLGPEHTYADGHGSLAPRSMLHHSKEPEP